MFNPTLLGVLTAMEERNAKDEDFPKESINATKASLMGPMSGIGDTIDKGNIKNNRNRSWMHIRFTGKLSWPDFIHVDIWCQ